MVYLPAGGLTALRPSEQPGSQVEVVWKEPKLGPSSPSPVLHDGRLYVINGAAGIDVRATPRAAKCCGGCRLGGKFWATPTIAGGHLYCVNDQGLVRVVKLGDTGEVIAENDFGEPILGSPAISDGAIYFRSDKRLSGRSGNRDGVRRYAETSSEVAAQDRWHGGTALAAFAGPGNARIAYRAKK